MANNTLKVRNRVATKKAIEWEEENPILLEGEIGFVTDEYRFKIGNGVDKWTDLKYADYELVSRIISLRDVVQTNKENITKNTNDISELKNQNDKQQIAIEDLNNTPLVSVAEDGFFITDNDGYVIFKATDKGIETPMSTLDENSYSYGVEIDTTSSSPTLKRIGNHQLHKSLPIQSKMKGCLLDDNGNVTKYLSDIDWVDDSSNIDGTEGQVMVEIPKFYYKFETDGDIQRVRISEYPLSGYKLSNTMYVGAYEASLQRSTRKLCSVCNYDADYRGGANQSDWDDTYRSVLGRPATSISRADFRQYARNRNTNVTNWNILTYQAYKLIYWLYTIEYASLNCQLAYNAELTSEGYHQGGLGAGVTNWSSTSWNNFNGYYPFIPCGCTNSLGNGTGIVPYEVKDADGNVLITTNVPRYRGIENPFGHIWKYVDGINIRISPTEENGGDGLSKVYVCKDTSLFIDTNYDGYDYVGNEARRNGYVKKIIFGDDGEIMPLEVDGGTTSYFCDYHYTNIPTSAENLRAVLFGGYAYSGSLAGFSYAYSYYAPSTASALFGSRLCFVK